MSKTQKYMNKAQAVREILRSGDLEASFVLNLCQHLHGNKATMIIGLANLISSGHEVKTAQHALDILLIDGVQASWVVLSEWALRLSSPPVPSEQS